jgi:hypothetical protein
MNNIPTAEELLLEIMGCLKMDYSLQELNEFDSDLVPFLVEQINNRTKLHVEAALKAAIEKVEIHSDSHHNLSRDFEYAIESKRIWIPDNSILNAYPLDLIK